MPGPPAEAVGGRERPAPPGRGGGASRGRRGRAALSADTGPREARGLLRRALPHHRLHALELHQLRAAQDLHATQYKSQSLNRHIRMGWSVVNTELGEFVEILPPQKRVGENWYLGHSRRRLPEPLLHRAREPALGDRPVGRPHLQDGLRQDARRPHRARARTLTVAAIEVPRGGRRGASASSRWTTTSRVIGFQEKPRDRDAATPWNPDFCLGSMGIYIFDTDVLVHELVKRRRRSPRATTSARTSSRRSSRPRARLRLHVLGREQEGVQVLARRRDHRRLLRGLHGPHPGGPRLQPLRPGLAACAPTSRSSRPPSSSSPRTGAEARPTRLDRLDGLHRLGQRVQRSILSPERARALLLRHPGLDPDAQRGRAPLRPHPPRHRRPRRRDPEGAVIGYDPVEDRRRHTVSEGGVVVVTPGEECFVDPQRRRFLEEIS